MVDTLPWIIGLLAELRWASYLYNQCANIKGCVSVCPSYTLIAQQIWFSGHLCLLLYNIYKKHNLLYCRIWITNHFSYRLDCYLAGHFNYKKQKKNNEHIASKQWETDCFCILVLVYSVLKGFFSHPVWNCFSCHVFWRLQVRWPFSGMISFMTCFD